MKKSGLYRTGYVSEIDQFLREFDQNRSDLPQSRLQEVKKFSKIYAKRDKVIEEPDNHIWKDF